MVCLPERGARRELYGCGTVAVVPDGLETPKGWHAGVRSYAHRRDKSRYESRNNCADVDRSAPEIECQYHSMERHRCGHAKLRQKCASAGNVVRQGARCSMLLAI